MEKIETIEEIEEMIALQANRPKGNMTHNIISSNLRIIAAKFGKAEANRIIDEYDLESEFQIMKV